MPAQRINIERAKPEKLFYFVANVVVYRESDARCLVLKRSEKEKVHPGRYCVPGGKLEWKDFDVSKPTRVNGDVLDFENAIENLLQREVREEASVEIKLPLAYVNSVAFVRPDGTPSILIKFAARYKSGEVVLEKNSFVDYAWVNAEEVREYSCIAGISEEVAATIKLFSNR